MGIVITQSFKNVISTYLGFIIGAINVLFLYTKFLSDEYYGMVGYMLSLANVIMPLMAFGVHNTLVKFYSSYKTRVSLNSFLTLMLYLPLLLIIPISLLIYCSHETISYFLSSKNEIIKDYLWHTLIIAISLAYFEVFYAWCKVQMKTVFGNFMKEVFHRAAAMVLLFLLSLKVIDIALFMWGLVIIYLLRMLIMMVNACIIKLPVITFKYVPNLSSILKYSFLIILAGSIATILLDIDKVMLGSFIDINQIAYYNVAIYIATVIAVPQRAMHQILLPVIAKYLNDKNYDALQILYKKSSLTLFIVAGLIFLLIVLNINQLYLILPKPFSDGLFVVFIISLSKLYDTVLGSNNAILFNSDYYRMVLIMGVILVVLMILLNMFFIPIYGINGAAIATFLALFIYNSIKLYFVYLKFKIKPFTINTLKICGVLILSFAVFYFWDFPFTPIINMVLKSGLITVFYVFIIYKYHFSEDISMLLNRYLFFKKHND